MISQRLKESKSSKLRTNRNYTLMNIGWKIQSDWEGNNIIVKIDETKLNFNVRSYRDRSPAEPVWTITMTETDKKPAR